jgi:hypothetical protein
MDELAAVQVGGHRGEVIGPLACNLSLVRAR